MMDCKFPLVFGLLALIACGEPEKTPTASTPSITAPPGSAPGETAGEAIPPQPPSQPVGPGAIEMPATVSSPVTDSPPAETPDEEVKDLLDDTLRINQIQARGTHNSYHLHPLDNPYLSWQYDMPTLTDQLEYHGIRALELDVHADNGEIRVYHIAEDPRSTCSPLDACLSEIVAWSVQHPAHVPIAVFLELKGAWTSANVTAMDQMVRAAVPAPVLFTPDNLTRGRYANVLQAMQNEGWPYLGEMRGKILFTMMAYSPLPSNYTDGGRTLQGRAMFLTATSNSSPHVVMLASDFSVEQEQAIQDSVMQGYLVRTRSDTYPGRTNDPGATFRAALRSGAHFILTDYPTGSSYFPEYSSVLPGGTPVRCNPVSAGADCENEVFEPY